MHQGSVLSPLIFAIVVDVVTEHAREGLLNEMFFADDLVLMTESLGNLRERFQRWRSAMEDKGLKVNVGKTKMMVSGTEGEIVFSKIDPCETCGKRVGSNAVCCTQRSTKWIHRRLEWSITKWKKLKFVESFLHIANFLPSGNYNNPAKVQLDLMKLRGRSKLHNAHLYRFVEYAYACRYGL